MQPLPDLPFELILEIGKSDINTHYKLTLSSKQYYEHYSSTINRLKIQKHFTQIIQVETRFYHMLNGRLHREDGPALEFKSDILINFPGEYYLNGVRFTQGGHRQKILFETLARLSGKRIIESSIPLGVTNLDD